MKKREFRNMVAMLLALIMMAAVLPVASVSASSHIVSKMTYAAVAYSNEWDAPRKTTDGRRAILLINNKTQKAYRIETADDYARIRYGKSYASYAHDIEFNNILHNLFDCVSNHVHTYAPVIVGEKVYYGCIKCAKKTTYEESKQTLNTFAWRMYNNPINRLYGYDLYFVTCYYKSYFYNISIHEAGLL